MTIRRVWPPLVAVVVIACTRPQASAPPARGPSAGDSARGAMATAPVGQPVAPDGAERVRTGAAEAESVTDVTTPVAPAPPLAPILARHRAAIGGDAAVAKAARVSLVTSLTMYGLAATVRELVDGERSRDELVIPSLPLEQIEVWDGKHLTVRGTNGDVRRQGRAEAAARATAAAVRSLAYLRPGFAGVSALAPVTDADARFDRLAVRAAGAEPTELWIDQAGLARRMVVRKDGAETVTFFDEYADYEGLRMPKRARSRKTTEKNEQTELLKEVRFPASVRADAFEPPRPRVDASFAPGVTSISLPLALLHGRWIVVQAKLGGQLGEFLVDSGASSTVYDLEFLKRVGAAPKGEVAPASGLFKGLSFVRAPKLELAGMTVAPQTVLAIDLRGSDAPLKVDGILGYDLLSRIVTTIDYPAGKLTFAAPGAWEPAPGDVVVPFELEETSVRVPVQVNGRDAGAFELDTGNGGSCTIHHVPFARELVPRSPALRDPRGIHFGTGMAAAFQTHADIIVGTRAGAVVWKDAPVRLLDPDDASARTVQGNGNLGYQWLRNLRITLDYGRQRLAIRQLLPYRPASAVGLFGVSVGKKDGVFRARDVLPGGPAERAGLADGDEIVEVGGIAVEAAGDQAYRFFGDAAPGEPRSVRVRRDGKTVDLVVTAVAQP